MQNMKTKNKIKNKNKALYSYSGTLENLIKDLQKKIRQHKKKK